MRLLVVNPNTSAAMTATILAAAHQLVGPGVDIDAINPARGPVSVEGHFDEVVTAYCTLEAVVPVAGRYDGLVVACYSNHPVIGALREALHQPVVGILEASVLHALMLGRRFSIVTTSPRWRPLLEEGVRALGLAERCASVRSSGLSVLEVGELPSAVVAERLCAEAQAAIKEDGAEVICLGCAGMVGLEAAVAAATGVPIIDGVRAAVAMVRGLVETGAQTSKRDLYRPPEPRQAAGLPNGIAAVYRPIETDGTVAAAAR